MFVSFWSFLVQKQALETRKFWVRHVRQVAGQLFVQGDVHRLLPLQDRVEHQEESAMKKIGAFLAQLLVSASSTLVSRGVVKFGPGNCVSAWVGEASHCVVRTACGAQPAFAAFAIRVVCVDEDGGRVLHTFQQGGFDAEETFNTNIKCHRVEAGDSVQVPQLSAAATSKGTAGSPPAQAAPHHWAAAAGAEANEAASQQLSKLESQVQLLTSNEIEMKREIQELQARLNGSESRALRGRTEEGSRTSAQALDNVAAALAAVSAPNPQQSQSPAVHTQPAKSARPAVQAPPASPVTLASRVHITAVSPSSSTAKPVTAPATLAAFAAQDPTIAASAESAAQEAEKAAAEAELEAQGAQSLALAPPVKLGSGAKEDLEDEKLVSLMDDGDAGDDDA
ncbi:unnamed protein product [Symbiodinium sp. CCMP2592]|nr:unnamed protein product [Symbiodinium sp. CCMP2592]